MNQYKLNDKTPFPQNIVDGLIDGLLQDDQGARTWEIIDGATGKRVGEHYGTEVEAWEAIAGGTFERTAKSPPAVSVGADRMGGSDEDAREVDEANEADEARDAGDSHPGDYVVVDESRAGGSSVWRVSGPRLRSLGWTMPPLAIDLRGLLGKLALALVLLAPILALAVGCYLLWIHAGAASDGVILATIEVLERVWVWHGATFVDGIGDGGVLRFIVMCLLGIVVAIVMVVVSIFATLAAVALGWLLKVKALQVVLSLCVAGLVIAWGNLITDL
jgi:hypothetical protein